MLDDLEDAVSVVLRRLPKPDPIEEAVGVVSAFTVTINNSARRAVNALLDMGWRPPEAGQ